MPKVFLSHSSSDKEKYIKIVANQLINKVGHHNVIYDEYTFEEGMKSIEEIEANLQKTDLFVIFLSSAALESKWVIEELKKAEYLLESNIINRIYPIIIDSDINHKDSRIPSWMLDYNLKLVTRPTKAVNMIRQRLVEISWLTHPRLKEREDIFVGRNDYIKGFEERLDSLDKENPICFNTSGIKSIGRFSLLKRCLIKSNIIKPSYSPLVISLNSYESLEDFILKLYDLGFSEGLDLKNFMKITSEEKQEIAVDIILEIQSFDEIVFIQDDGCIVSHKGLMSDWFFKILNKIKYTNKITFGVIARFRLTMKDLWQHPYIYSMELLELQKKERDGLLKRYADFEELNLERDDLMLISGLLNGYPEQVFHAIELAKRDLKNLKDNTDEIVEFNSEKARILLRDYDNDSKTLNFLYLLSRFDYMSFNFIFEIVEEVDYYSEKLSDFFHKGICEYAGTNNEYVRINQTVSDYIQRTELKISKDYELKLEDKLTQFLSHADIESYDIPEFLFSVKEALLKGHKVDSNLLIPSHYLKSMVELYKEKRNYHEVIRFADKALENEAFMEERIVFEIRYFLCQSLAKLQDRRVLNEVQKISGPDHNFILGFYYRQVGQNEKALIELHKSLERRPRFSKAKRELVQVYINLQEYSKATELASENYDNDKSNPYHSQAYFKCLIKGEQSEERERKLLQIIDSLSKLNNNKANEMLLRCKAQYEAYYCNNESLSLELINKAISMYPSLVYARIVKFEICDKFNRIDDLKDIISFYEKTEYKKRDQNQIINFKAILIAKEGNIDEAIDYFMKNIKNYTDQAKEKTKTRLLKYSNAR